MSQSNLDRVRLTLMGADVVSDFRSALFEEANKAGVSPNEFVLRSAAEKLADRGHRLAGVFEIGDIDEVRI